MIGWPRCALRSGEAGIGTGGVVGHRAAVQSGDGGVGWRERERGRGRGRLSRQSVHAWVRRYRAAGLAGLADRSQRTRVVPASGVGGARGGGLRVAARASEVGRVADPARADARAGPLGALPSRSTVNRILVRHGLVFPRARGASARTMCVGSGPAAMQLWQLDIVYGRGWSTPSRARCARRGSSPASMTTRAICVLAPRWSSARPAARSVSRSREALRALRGAGGGADR